MGENNLSSPIDCEQGGLAVKNCANPHVDLPVDKIIKHKDFDELTLKNDIALVKVKGSIKFTDYIQPICLPFDKGLETRNFLDEKFTISGWGKLSSSNFAGSNVLQHAQVKVWDIFKCNTIVPEDVRPIQNSQLCANGVEAEDACKGDSGGPLFNMTIEGKDIKTYQIGIISFAAARSCGNIELPTIYTRVDFYLKWIVNNVK